MCRNGAHHIHSVVTEGALVQITTQRSPTRTLVAAASDLTLALSAAVAHASSIDPYQPAYRVNRADPYTDGAKVSRTSPCTDGAKMGHTDPYTDGACSDRQPQKIGGRIATASQHQARAIPGLFLCTPLWRAPRAKASCAGAQQT